MKRKVKVIVSTLLTISVLFANINLVQASQLVPEKKDSIYVTIGDSITARDRQQFNPDESPYVGFQHTINEKLGYDNFINIGISGSTIARGTPYLRGLSKLCDAMYFGNNVDFILIGAGTNDFGQSTPLGTPEEMAKHTPNPYNFYGGYTKLIKDIRRNNPSAQIILWTPMQRSGNNPSYRPNNLGLTLYDYVEATKKIGETLDVDVIDVFGSPKMSIRNVYLYTDSAGLHPTNDGYVILGEILSEGIKLAQEARLAKMKEMGNTNFSK